MRSVYTAPMDLGKLDNIEMSGDMDIPIFGMDTSITMEVAASQRHTGEAGKNLRGDRFTVVKRWKQNSSPLIFPGCSCESYMICSIFIFAQ